MKRYPISDHFDGRHFFNPGERAERGFRDLLRWRMSRRPAPWPERVPVRPAAPPPAPPSGKVTLSWIGHSSFLVRSPASTWLADPVFSDRVGPAPGLGMRRVARAALRPEALPPIDAVLVSHDHFDHCDLPSLRALARGKRGPPVIAPLGHGFLRRRGAAARLIELDWWQRWEAPDGSSAEFVPARHWCRRSFGRTNVRLWGGYYLRLAGRSVYFAGDSAYDPGLFSEIRRRCGAPEVALLPIGAYEPRWFMRDAHMNPAEAVRAHRDLGAALSIGMHWGAFPLADEAREAPLRDLEAARAEAGLGPEEFRVLQPGQSLTL